jgi:TPR repeat protein
MMKISNSDSKSLASTAQFNVGRAYFQGYGIKQSTDEAVKWWEKCAKSNTPAAMRAMNTLALLYSTPDLVNEEKAFHWHVLAAERGHMDSMGTLGLLYMKGHGCAANKELALKWFKKSAENGSIYGSGLLSNYYYSNKMYSKAVEMARSVCDCNQEDIDKLTVLCQSIPSLIIEGLATANYIYGQCLYHGQGTVKDTQLSHSYFIKVCKFKTFYNYYFYRQEIIIPLLLLDYIQG